MPFLNRRQSIAGVFGEDTVNERNVSQVIVKKPVNCNNSADPVNRPSLEKLF